MFRKIFDFNFSHFFGIIVKQLFENSDIFKNKASFVIMEKI